jgi:hypothetical protein
VSPAGRTSWWGKDAAWHRRELIVELGEEFGAEGPNVMDVLSSWAQEQREAGAVRGGFRTLARESFVTVSHAESIVSRAAEIGALDDLEIDADGRRFTCRVSGWKADQDRARAAVRQAAKRNQADEDSKTEDAVVTACHGESRSVTPSALPDHIEKNPPTPQGESAGEPGDSMAARRLFTYWQERCGHDTAKLTRDRRRKLEARLREGYSEQQIRQAIDGAALRPFVNDAGKRFDDLELICRNGSKLEDFMERGVSRSVSSLQLARNLQRPGPAA